MDTLLVEKATQNVRDILSEAILYTSAERALVVYDTDSELAQILVQAYKNALPDARFVDFGQSHKDEIIGLFNSLSPKDLVVLIQTSDFRLNEFRIRIYLFEKGLKVVDHLHLYRNTPDSYETYIDALAYDSAWYRGVGRRLKGILEKTEELRIIGRDTTLTITKGLEEPKLNVGDYTGMKNIGGTFPIGEVFTEAKDFGGMNGSLRIHAFANIDFNITFFEPFTIHITEGILTGWSEDTPQSFIDVVEQVRSHERALIREIGFGMNRAISRERPLKDITAFERNLGLHVSLGEKHSVFKKPGISADKTRFHVDLFPAVDTVFADEEIIFENGTYTV